MKSIHEAVEQLRTSRAFECCPAGYTTEFLEKYAQGEITRRELYVQYDKATREAQFFFSHMPPEHVKENQRLFKKEFDFADAIYAVTRQAPDLNDSQLQEKIAACIEAYFESLDEAQ